MGKTKETSVMRTSSGLRDALFDELESLRNGTSNPTRANAVAKLSGSIVDTVKMELDVHKYVSQTGKDLETKSPIKSLPLGG